MNRRPILMKRRQDGIALLEALLAAVLLAIGLLGTVGLQARAYSALSEAGMRAEATIAAEHLLGMMTTDVAHLADYKVASCEDAGDRLKAWCKATDNSIPGANVQVDVKPGAVTDAPSDVTITISWQRKPDAPLNTHTVRAFI